MFKTATLAAVAAALTMVATPAASQAGTRMAREARPAPVHTAPARAECGLTKMFERLRAARAERRAHVREVRVVRERPARVARTHKPLK